MGNGRIFKMNTPSDIEQDMIPSSSYFIATGFIDMLPTPAGGAARNGKSGG